MPVLQGDALSFAGLEERSNHTGKVHVARNFKQDAPSSAAYKELNATNNQVSLEVDPSPFEPQVGPQPWPAP